MYQIGIADKCHDGSGMFRVLQKMFSNLSFAEALQKRNELSQPKKAKKSRKPLYYIILKQDDNV